MGLRILMRENNLVLVLTLNDVVMPLDKAVKSNFFAQKFLEKFQISDLQQNSW